MDTRLQAIPEGSVEVQTGLWAYLREYTFNGQPRARYVLYSAEGYCFYSLSIPENYVDGEVGGELLPLEQRVFYQFMSTTYTTVEQINADIVSVPVQDGYEIVSVGGNQETV